MKKGQLIKAIIITLVFSFSVFANSNIVMGNKIETLTKKSQNVLLAKIHSQTDNSFFVEVLWELKGEVYSEILEIPVESKKDLGFTLHTDDRILVFVDRYAEPGFVGLPHESFAFSKYDRFNGVSVFRKIEGSDYLIVSEAQSFINKSETVIALSSN